MKFKINDVVELNKAIPIFQLKKGAVGVVVEVFSEPSIAYEIEFSDEQGKTLAVLAIKEKDLRKETF